MIWTYENVEVTSIPENAFGFIYIIEYTDDTLYLGKKNFYIEQQLPALKNGTVRPEALYRIGRNVKGKRLQFDVVRKESAWKKYIGSSALTKGKKIKSKTILAYATSKRELTYLENKYLFCYEAIENESFLNENIMGRFFRGNLK